MLYSFLKLQSLESCICRYYAFSFLLVFILAACSCFIGLFKRFVFATSKHFGQLHYLASIYVQFLFGCLNWIILDSVIVLWGKKSSGISTFYVYHSLDMKSSIFLLLLEIFSLFLIFTVKILITKYYNSLYCLSAHTLEAFLDAGHLIVIVQITAWSHVHSVLPVQCKWLQECRFGWSAFKVIWGSSHSEITCIIYPSIQKP